MNVASVAGNTSGFTAVTVEPTLTSGNSYKYKTAANPVTPQEGATCTTGYKAWDGSSDIEAATGRKIVVVEVDTKNRCIAAGTAVIVSAE